MLREEYDITKVTDKDLLNIIKDCNDMRACGLYMYYYPNRLEEIPDPTSWEKLFVNTVKLCGRLLARHANGVR